MELHTKIICCAGELHAQWHNLEEKQVQLNEAQLKLDKQEAQLRNKYLEMVQQEQKAQARERLFTEREQILSTNEAKLRQYQGMMDIDYKGLSFQ